MKTLLKSGLGIALLASAFSVNAQSITQDYKLLGSESNTEAQLSIDMKDIPDLIKENKQARRALIKLKEADRETKAEIAALRKKASAQYAKSMFFVREAIALNMKKKRLEGSIDKKNERIARLEQKGKKAKTIQKLKAEIVEHQEELKKVKGRFKFVKDKAIKAYEKGAQADKDAKALEQQ